MAYADQKSGIDPKSLSVTVAVNGGIIAALLLLGGAATVIQDPPMIVENWANPVAQTPPSMTWLLIQNASISTAY